MSCYLVLLLQVWYAASYAEFVNQKIHDITEEERKGNLGSSAFSVLVVAGYTPYFQVYGLYSAPQICARLGKVKPDLDCVIGAYFQ